MTSSPVSTTSYADLGGIPSSTTTDIHYCVVAVDALGQERVSSERSDMNRTAEAFYTTYGYLTNYNSGIGTGAAGTGTIYTGSGGTGTTGGRGVIGVA